MLYNVRLYYNTGFDLENIPDSPSLLDNCSYRDIQGHWDLQSLNLTSLRLNIQWKDIKNCDYLRFGTPNDTVNGCGYYIVVGRKQINLNMCIVALELDSLTTLGGAKNLKYIGGFIDRAHPSSTDEQIINTLDETIAPSNILIAETNNVNISGITRNYVVSTINLDQYKTWDENNMPLKKMRAMPYYIPGSTPQEEDQALFIPEPMELALPTRLILGEGNTGRGSYYTSGYGLYDAAKYTTKMNMQYAISLGLTGSLLYSYSPRTFGGSPNDGDTQDGNGHITQLIGGGGVSQITINRPINPKYRKTKFLYSSIVMTSSVSGNSKELNLADCVLPNNDNIFEYVYESDPSPDGKVFLRPSYIQGHYTVIINEQAVAGGQWIKQPISSNTSGILMADTNYGLQIKAASTEYKYDQIMEGTQMVGGAASGALKTASQATSIWNPVSGQLQAAATAVDTAFDTAVHVESMMKRGAMHEIKSNKMLFERAAAHIQTPNLSCPPGMGLNNFIGDKEFVIYYVHPTSEDMARFDKYFDLYGYRMDKAFSKSYLTNKSNFNYIQANNVKINRQHGSIETRRQAEAQLNGGVRIWHNLPNNNWADGSLGE